MFAVGHRPERLYLWLMIKLLECCDKWSVLANSSGAYAKGVVVFSV